MTLRLPHIATLRRCGLDLNSSRAVLPRPGGSQSPRHPAPAGPARRPPGLARATAALAGLRAAWLLAAVTGRGLMAAGRANRKTQLPFGPFLIAATVGAALAVRIDG